ncbi:MAG: hypothetical protein WC116_09955, partial [Thermovirgaceae bacterium]
LMALVEVSGPFAFFRIYKLRIKNKIPWSFSCRKNRDCVQTFRWIFHQGEKHTAGNPWDPRIAVFSGKPGDIDKEVSPAGDIPGILESDIVSDYPGFDPFFQEWDFIQQPQGHTFLSRPDHHVPG